MKKQFQVTLAAVAVAAAIGCNNPADNVAEAQVNEPAKPAAPEPAPAAADTNAPAASTPAPAAAAKTYLISPDSKIDFLASKAIGGETPGSFKKFVGQLNVVDGKFSPEGSKVTIDVDSITTEKEKLTAHLKNEDFFDVPKFPTATFEATKIESMPEDATKQNLTGNLTMHGVTKSITFPVSLSVTDEAIALKSEFFINRYDFGMEYKGQADNMIRKEVVLKLDVKAVPAAAEPKAL